MSQIKVLLVDDEEEFIKALAERMTLRDLKTEVALDGQEALQAVAREAPEVMVLDLRMPGLDGLEVLRRVRRSHPQVQVIVLTGHGSDRDEQQARRLGAFEFLQKPVDIEDLVRTVKQAHWAAGELEGRPKATA